MSQTIVTTQPPFYILEGWYTSREAAGVTALIVAGSISAISVLGLLLTILVSTIRTIRDPSKHLFARSHVGLYFISLLLTDLTQSVGGIMNVKWIMEKHVSLGGYCTAQGAVKQAGNLGTALWSLIIAFHTFNLLFLRLQLKNYVCYGVLIATWSLIGAFIIAGPAAIESPTKGPYFGVTGYWCWINDAYGAPRLFLEYLWVFISAFASFVLYSLVFLRLRGNVYIIGWVPHFRWVSRENAWKLQTGRDLVDTQMMTVARQMLWYPVAYTVLILPIAAARYADFAGHEVPFEVTIFSGVVFMLSGFVNTVLFTTTRRIVPKREALPSFNIPRPTSVPHSVHKTGIDPFILPGSEKPATSPTGSERSFVSADVRSSNSSFSERDLDIETAALPRPSFTHNRRLSPVHERSESIASTDTFRSAVSSSSTGSQVGLRAGNATGGIHVDDMRPIAKNASMAGRVDPHSIRRPGRSRSASLSSRHSKREVDHAHVHPGGDMF